MGEPGGIPCRLCGDPLPKRLEIMGVCVKCVMLAGQQRVTVPTPSYREDHDG